MGGPAPCDRIAARKSDRRARRLAPLTPARFQYGALRPLDAVQAHRLDMDSRGVLADGALLKNFWKPHITEALNAALDGAQAPLLVDVASKESSNAVDLAGLRKQGVRVVECAFLTDGKSPSVYAKQARGAMVNYIVTNAVETVGGVQGFDQDGYRYDEKASAGDKLVFTRSKPAAKPKPPPKKRAGGIKKYCIISAKITARPQRAAPNLEIIFSFSGLSKCDALEDTGETLVEDRHPIYSYP